MQKIRNRPDWKNQAAWLAASPQSSLEFYNPLVMSKLRLTRDVARWNPFNTEGFLWIDGRRCDVWCCLVWSGLVWCCLVWSGLVWCCLVWSGLVWCLVWSGLVWCCVHLVSHLVRFAGKHNCNDVRRINKKKERYMTSFLDRLLITYFDYDPYTEVHGFSHEPFDQYLGVDVRDRKAVKVGRGGIFGGNRAYLEVASELPHCAAGFLLKDSW